MALLADYGVGIEWGESPGENTFTIGVSTIGGPDVIGTSGFDEFFTDGLPVEVTIDRADGQQGTARIVLHDPNGSYNPANPAAAHAPHVVPMRRVRVTVDNATPGSWGGPRMLGGDPDRQYLFAGYTARIRHDPSPLARQTVVEAVDGFEVINLARPLVPEMGTTTVGAAVHAVLLASGVPVEDLNLDLGVPIAGFSATGDRTALDLIRDLMVVERGSFYVAGDGRFTLVGREALLGAVQAAVHLDSAEFGGLVPEVDKDEIVNQLTVTRTGGVPQTASDPQSQRRYFQRPGADVESAYFPDDAAALALANYVVQTRATPTVRVRSVTLPGMTYGQVAIQAQVDIGTRLSLDEPLGGTRSGGYVKRVQHRITKAGGHTTAIDVERLPFTAFVIGVSAVGGDDRLGF